jgi:FemAB family protein
MESIEKLNEAIMSQYSNITFALSDWCKVIDNSSDVLVFHLISAVDYYAEYFKGKNLSFVLYENNKPVAVFPLYVYQNEDGWSINGNAESLVKPLFVDNIANKTKKRLEKQIVQILLFIANKLGVKEVQIFEPNTTLSTWFLLWANQARKNFFIQRLVIDLQLSIDIIRLGFRKSYKPLVKKSMTEFKVMVCENDLDYFFEEFRLLHIEMAGKETRSKETWNIQKEQIKNDEAFLVTVMDGDYLVGAGFFHYTKNMGIYSCGAYRRRLFDRPVSHGVQMKAIEILKEKGCKTYYLGQKMSLLDEKIPSEKELSISHFKEGFSGYVFAEPCLKVFFHE